MGWTVRPATSDDVPELLRADWAAFGMRPSDVQIEEARQFLEVDRTLLAVEGDRVVGTAGMLGLELTVPGPNTVPAAAVTQVGVLPTHRRQGIFTCMMAGLHDDARRRQEPVAALLASEGSIYRRLGYGVAVTSSTAEIDRVHTTFLHPAAPAAPVRMVEPEEMSKVLPAIHDRYRRQQPGEVSRPPGWWARRLVDREDQRGGASARFAVVWEDSGYVTYRLRGRWDEGSPSYVLEVEELVALTPEGRAGLLRYCAGIDLVGLVKLGNVPVDDPFRWMLRDFRRLRVTSIKDFLWVRLLDVAAALDARAYQSDDTLVLDVVDPSSLGSDGRYELAAGVCRRTDRAADLRLDVADLAAAYLGGVRFSTLARAGLVAELTPGSLRRADALFATASAPFCCTGF